MASGLILSDTRRIIHSGEQNYIMALFNFLYILFLICSKFSASLVAGGISSYQTYLPNT